MFCNETVMTTTDQTKLHQTLDNLYFSSYIW